MSTHLLAHPLVLVRSLRKTYKRRSGWRVDRVTALDDVGLIVRSGQTLAVVGESGSGKSTLALCLAALERPDSGEIWFEGDDLANLSASELRKLRPKFQLIQQDSAGALNPRFTAKQVLEEPLRIQRVCTAAGRREQVNDVMVRVGLRPEWKERYPHQFSGGQRQRLAIARALILQPQLLILDEPFTGLDLSIRGQIINLLLDLQRDYGLTYVYVSHDLDVVRYFADEIAVMDRGRIVEQASAHQLFAAPSHQRTLDLLSAKGQRESLADAAVQEL